MLFILKKVTLVLCQVIIIFVLGSVSVLAQKTTLDIVTIKGSTNSEPSKMVLEEAYQQIGIDIKVAYQPGARALISSSKGIFDGELQRIFAIGEKVPSLVRVPVSIGSFGGFVVTKNLDFDVTNWESLKPYKIGIVRGVKFTERGTKGMNVHLTKSVTHALRMLDRGRVDIVVTSYLSALKGIKKNKLKSLRILNTPVQEFKLYHYLHKKNQHLVPKLSIVLEKMKKQGRIKEIWDQYAKKIK